MAKQARGKALKAKQIREAFKPVASLSPVNGDFYRNADVLDERNRATDRLQNATSCKDTAKVLRMTRAGVAWFAVGCQMGAYEHALRYAQTASSSAGRSAESSWSMTCWWTCWCACAAT
jgi:hypothetical protein